MKKLLLTSALVAVSGAALAEITWSGDAEIGIRSHNDAGWLLDGDADGVDTNGDGEINDEDAGFIHDGNPFYFEADLNVVGTAELDSGVSVELEYGFGLDYGLDAGAHGDDNAFDFDAFPTLTLTSSVGTLVIGDTDHAAHEKIGDLSGSLDDYFDENDGGLIARADTNVAGFGFAASTGLSEHADYADDEVLSVLDTDLYREELVTVLDAELADGVINAAQYAAALTEWDAFADAHAKDVSVGDISIAATGDLMGVSGVLAFETRDNDHSVAGIAKYTWNGISGTVGAASAALDLDGDGDHDADQRTWSVAAGYDLNGIALSAEVYNTKLNVGGAEDDWTGYEIAAGFEMYGADVTLSYEDNNTDNDAEGDQGFAIDAAYEVAPGVTILAGYDETEAKLIGDDKGELGAAYVGTTYDLGSGASVFATWSNGDEFGDPEYKVGSTLGVAFTF